MNWRMNMNPSTNQFGNRVRVVRVQTVVKLGKTLVNGTEISRSHQQLVSCLPKYWTLPMMLLVLLNGTINLWSPWISAARPVICPRKWSWIGAQGPSSSGRWMVRIPAKCWRPALNVSQVASAGGGDRDAMIHAMVLGFRKEWFGLQNLPNSLSY
jgi:hypothetical protein